MSAAENPTPVNQDDLICPCDGTFKSTCGLLQTVNILMKRAPRRLGYLLVVSVCLVLVDGLLALQLKVLPSRPGWFKLMASDKVSNI